MFKTEKDLVKNITSNLMKNNVVGFSFQTNQNKKIFHELKLGYGVPDVVVTHYNLPSELRSTCLEYFDILVLDFILRQREVTIDIVTRTTRSSVIKVRKSLGKLLKDDFISVNNDLYKPNKPYQKILTQTFAIEAKLYSWKRALYQAYRYKWFSEQSFVFLPEENIAPAERNINKFEQLEVGLASVTKDSIKVIFAPKPSDPICSNMHSVLNELVIHMERKQLGKFRL